MRYNKNIKIQEFNVLTKLNHNVGNVHKQYVGNDRDTMIKPAYDLNLPSNNSNNFWKICDFTIYKNKPNYLTLCFDLFDEYQGITLEKNSFEIGIFPTSEKDNSSAFYSNGIFKKIFGSGYNRVLLEEIKINENEYNIKIYIKNSIQWNFPKLCVRYLQTNIKDFELIDNEPMIIGDNFKGNLIYNTPFCCNIKSNRIEENGYIKVAKLNFNFNNASSCYKIDINIINEYASNNSKTGTLVLQAYNSGINLSGYTSTKFYLTNNLNMNESDIVVIKNEKEFNIYINVLKNDRVFLKLYDNLDIYSRGNRELEFSKFEYSESLPVENRVIVKSSNNLYLTSYEDNKNYEIKMKDYNLKLLQNNEVVANMVKPQQQDNFSAESVEQLVDQLNKFLVKLKTSQVIK